MKIPKRTDEHVLEELSIRFFQNCLPSTWASSKAANDYGIDLQVDIFDSTDATPYKLYIQLKSSKIKSTGKFEKVRLRVATYNLLFNSLHVTMLVKFVHEINDAYYMLLVDLPDPDQNKKSFTINFPPNNRLSSIDWRQIYVYIKDVEDFKFTAAEAIRNRRRATKQDRNRL